MNEVSLRKWHRSLGIILALFLFVQATTGALMAVQFALKYSEPFDALEILHTGGGLAGSLYRVLLGLGLMTMVITGVLIYLKIRGRTRKQKAQ